MTGDQTVMMLPIAEIGELDASDYVGLIDQTAVECLAARLEIDGLHTPIWVRRNGNAAKVRWSVIAGRHRLLAACSLDWTEIAAEERAGPDSKSAELRRLQVIENLDRRGMRPIERALFIMERWKEAAAAHPASAPGTQQEAAVRERWSYGKPIAHAPHADRRATDAETAISCDLGARSVRTYRRIFEKIVGDLSDLYAQLNAHPLGGDLSAMSTLASIRMPDTRRKAAVFILSRADWKSIEEAMVAGGFEASKGNRSSPLELAKNRWMNLPPEHRKAHLRWLAAEAPLTPSIAIEMVASFRARGLLPS